ncbi:MAG: hypothetical protein ABL982_16810 [Vicinamibacterales bacterium]
MPRGQYGAANGRPLQPAVDRPQRMAVAALTDQNATEMVRQGQNEIARAALLANVAIHSNEMYGTGAVYLRAKGLVPPSTERAASAPGRGGPGH